MENQTAIKHVQKELYRLGLSMRSFARKHGFNEISVISSIYRHAGRETKPRGITKKILEKLHEEIGNGR